VFQAEAMIIFWRRARKA